MTRPPTSTAGRGPRRRRGLAPSLLAAALSLAPAARAQQFDGRQPLDTFTGPVVSTGRVLGLGGAYVGVGEGLQGVDTNPAAVANRRGDLDRAWDWDWLASTYLSNVAEMERQDIGNDGFPDGRLDGFGNALVGLSGQLGRYGGAVLLHAWGVSADGARGETVEVGALGLTLTGGGALLDDQLLWGVSLASEAGGVTYRPPAGGSQRLPYRGLGGQVGLLWRPPGLPWRAGLAFDPGARAWPDGDRTTFPVTTPARLVFPWRVTGGFSTWVGPNAARRNDPPLVDLARDPRRAGGGPLEPGRPVLLSVQAALIGATPGALSLESGLFPGEPARYSGQRPSLSLHAGAEWEAWRRWVRVRGGGYLEPSRSGASARGHATFGAEVRVPFWPWDLQVALAGDVARRYQNVSLSLGFWGETGPFEAPARAPP